MLRLAKSQILCENFLTRSSNHPFQNSHPLFPLSLHAVDRAHNEEKSRDLRLREGPFKVPTKGPNCQQSAAFSRPRLPLRLPGRPVLTLSSASAPCGPLPTRRSATPGALLDGVGTRGHPGGPPAAARGRSLPPSLRPGRLAPRLRGSAPLPSRTTRTPGQPARWLVLRAPKGPSRPSAAAPRRGTTGHVTYLTVALAPWSGRRGGRDPRQRLRPAMESPPPRAPRPKPRSHSAAGRRVLKKLRWPST